MLRKAMVVAAMCVFVFSSAAYAQSVSLGLKAGSLGLGAEAEGNVLDAIGVRAGFNYLSVDYSGESDDIDYNFDLKAETVPLLLDWHPFAGSFRISGGVIFSNSSFEADAKSADTLDIGDTEYRGSDVGTLKGEIEFNKVNPYFGLGWDTSFGKKNKFAFISNLGVIYQGKPEVDLSANGPIANDPAFQRDLAKEESDMQDDLDRFQYYPVIEIGVAYRF